MPFVQLPLVGVTLYTAVAALAVVLVSVPVSVVLPVPDAPPVILLPVGALHEYVVPAGIILPVGVYVNPTDVQLLVLCAAIVATGLTVIVTVNTVPSKQLPDVGVTA